ncbi:uncharacterized protein FRV6_02998 [Fusarium oxysporum]|uniref:RanBP2-type domain-containing protein n=1 Tax=Fusarium oxysporum TaxID=5507 RepID=A0A2H3SZC0_FUSOX|nr:uncharacterized protein FRV6_02998 [Fusarium oxysporum]
MSLQLGSIIRVNCPYLDGRPGTLPVIWSLTLSRSFHSTSPYLPHHLLSATQSMNSATLFFVIIILFIISIFFINCTITIIIRTRSRHTKSKPSSPPIMSQPIKPYTPSPNVPPPPPPNPDTPTSSTFTGATFGIRPDHVAWKCHRGFFCNIINPLTDARCATCKQERAFPADALDASHKQIGWLQSVDLHGNEKWVYFDRETLDQLRQGTLPKNFLNSSPPVSWKSGGIDGINPENSRPVSEGSGDVIGIHHGNSPPVSSETGEVGGNSREGKRMSTGVGFEVSRMERWVANVVKKQVDDEDLEEPDKQPEDEGDAKGSAAGDGSGSKRKSQ